MQPAAFHRIMICATFCVYDMIQVLFLLQRSWHLLWFGVDWWNIRSLIYWRELGSIPLEILQAILSPAQSRMQQSLQRRRWNRRRWLASEIQPLDAKISQFPRVFRAVTSATEQPGLMTQAAAKTRTATKTDFHSWLSILLRNFLPLFTTFVGIN